jgi:uncharacterized damage-inducible protein DinB
VAEVPGAARAPRPSAPPHSIAEELWHIVFWQDLLLRWARLEQLPYPQRAHLGWRSLDGPDETEWRNLVARFETGLAEATRLAGTEGLAERPSTMPGPEPDGDPSTLLDVLTNIAVHNAYHLGRIVVLRQILGIWPPPGGGDAW